jgi:hypothetical protein
MRGVSVRDTSSPRMTVAFVLLCIRQASVRCHRVGCPFRDSCFSTIPKAWYPNISCRMSACSGTPIVTNAPTRHGQTGSNGRCIASCFRPGVATARSAFNSRHSSHIQSRRPVRYSGDCVHNLIAKWLSKELHSAASASRGLSVVEYISVHW